MATTTKPKVNLFTAGTKAKEPTKAKKEKRYVDCPSLESQVKDFTELKNQIEAKKAQLAMLEGDIKAAAKEIYMQQYRLLQARPDSFYIKEKSGEAILLIVKDQYKKVEDEKAEILSGSEYEGLLEEKVVFTVDPVMVEKYGQLISDFINDCKKIPDEDKELIIKGEKTYQIVKGSIDRLLSYKKPEQVFELIGPYVSIK